MLLRFSVGIAVESLSLFHLRIESCFSFLFGEPNQNLGRGLYADLKPV